MIDTVLYFFRQQKLLFSLGLLSITTIYSYLLSLYFLELSPFAFNLFNLLLIFSLVWLIATFMSFSKNKKNYAYQREKEKYELLRHQITLEYNLDIKDNIFSKVDLITTIMKENFSPQGLFSLRVFKVVNNSLHLYIENLKIKEHLNKAIVINEHSDKKSFYENELFKNKEQNSKIASNLDNFIEELTSKNNNDTKIEKLLNEFEHSTKILSKINHI